MFDHYHPPQFGAPKRVLAGKNARIFERLPPFRFVSQVIQDDWKMLWILGRDVRCDPLVVNYLDELSISLTIESLRLSTNPTATNSAENTTFMGEGGFF